MTVTSIAARKEILEDSRHSLTVDTDSLVSDLELRIDELESDLSNAIEDKDKWRDLVEGLAESLVCCIELINCDAVCGHPSKGCGGEDVDCERLVTAKSLIAKAKGES